MGYRATYPGPKIASGLSSVTYASATQQASVSVVFPSTFATGTTPKVVAVPVDPRFTLAVTGTNPTGFNLTAYYIPGNVLAGFTLSFYWIATL